MKADDVLGALGNLMGAFGSTAGKKGDGKDDGSCSFSCKGKGKSPVANPKHKPTANGCGIPGMQLDDVSSGFTSCCNEHDYCYDTCNNDKALCDSVFLRCMESSCEDDQQGAAEIDACKGKATMFYTACQMFGWYVSSS
jgi:secretory phospholipase A2